jgi:short-chain fatty acids transporter
MRFFHFFVKIMRLVFPSTFSIAIILTVITILLALLMTEPVSPLDADNTVLKEIAGDPLSNSGNHLLQILGFWYTGMWNTGLLAFAIQMMLILVLGYVLASTKPVRAIIEKALKYCTSTANAVFLVALLTILLSLFNWGLGLIFGAIFARKVGEYASRHAIPINYPLVGAAGYAGLMVWHGGISGSAPLKVAEAGHFLSLVGRDIQPVTFGLTVFSPMNITLAVILLLVIPAGLYLAGKRAGASIPAVTPAPEEITPFQDNKGNGAERIDHSRIMALLLA